MEIESHFAQEATRKIKELEDRLFALQKRVAIPVYGSSIREVCEYRFTEDTIYMIPLSGYPVYCAPRFRTERKETSNSVSIGDSAPYLRMLSSDSVSVYGNAYLYSGDILDAYGWEVVERRKYVSSNPYDRPVCVISRQTSAYKNRHRVIIEHWYRHKETGFVPYDPALNNSYLQFHDTKDIRITQKELREKGWSAEEAKAIQKAWNKLKQAATDREAAIKEQISHAVPFRKEYVRILEKYGWSIIEDPKNEQYSKGYGWNSGRRYYQCKYEGSSITASEKDFLKDFLSEINRVMGVHDTEKIQAMYNELESVVERVCKEYERTVKVISNTELSAHTAEKPYKTEKKHGRPPASSRNRYPYPENLIREIGLEYVFENGQYHELNTDQLKGLDYALGMLKTREADMLRLRYEKRLTYQKVAEKYSVNGSRAQQIIHKALNRLRKPEKLIYISKGYEGALVLLENEKKGRQDFVQKKITMLQKGEIPEGADILQELLSVRAYNRLRAAGLSKLEDVLEFLSERPEDLLKIRNLGPKLADEIKGKLEPYLAEKDEGN